LPAGAGGGNRTGAGDFIPVTNAIESLNSRFRQAVRRRGHFPHEQAALKVLYLVATERRKNRANPAGRINAWKPILNALTIHYGDRIQAAT
jgi:putative transposase